MDKLSAAQIGGIVRAVLGGVGGVLIAVGWIDETSWVTISGAVVTLVTVLWSLYSNSMVEQTRGVASSPEVKTITVSPELAYATNNPKVIPHDDYPEGNTR